nr:hypothetical protein OG409_26795 [Streptomyces sp. NBC_00974]
MAALGISDRATVKTAREALAASQAMTGAATEADLWRMLGGLEYIVEALLRVIDEPTEQ